MTAVCEWGGMIEVALGIARVFPEGEWDVSSWDAAEWSETDTSLGDWMDVTCDTLDGIRLAAGSSNVEGVVTRWEAATATLSLYGADYDPRIGQWADVLGPATPVRIRWRALDLARDVALPRTEDPWHVVFLGSVADGGYRWDPTTMTATLQCTDRTVDLATFETPALAPPVGGGDTAAGRITRLADAARWPAGERDITTGGVTLQQTDLAGMAWEQMLAVADCDLALLWTRRDGFLAYRPQGRLAQGVPVNARLVACPDDETPPPVTAAPVNLLTSNQADLEDGDTTGWSNTGGTTAAAKQTYADHGSWSLEGTKTAVTATVDITSTARPAIVPNHTYTFLASIRAPTGSRSDLQLGVCNAAGAVLYYPFNTLLSPAPIATAWTRYRVVFTTTSDPAIAFLHVRITSRDSPTGSAPIGAKFYIDRVGVMDGNVTDDQWSAWNVPAAGVRNLLPIDNLASVEEGATGGFTPIGTSTTLAATQSQAAVGKWSLRATGNTATSVIVYLWNSGVTGIPVTPNTTYTWMASLWANATSYNANLGVQFYDAAGTLIGATNWGANYAVPVGQWGRFRRVFATPANAVYLQLVLNYAGSVAGRWFLADRMGIFLGDIPSAEWQLPSAYDPPDEPPVQYVNLLHADPDVLRNFVVIARGKPDTAEGAPPPPEPVLVSLADDPSISRYRVHKYRRTDLDHADDAWSRSIAEVVLGDGAWPTSAPAEVQLDSRVTTDLAVPALLLGLEPEHTFTVEDPLNRDATWRMAPIGWDVNLGAAAVDGSVFLSDVSGWGLSAGWDDPLPAGWDYTTWGLGA